MKLVVHCQRAAFDVLIDRTTMWGNPFTHVRGARTLARFLVASRQEAIARYDDWLPTQPHLMDAIPSLSGKVLGCWCDPHPCHGHVLARRANGSLLSLVEATTEVTVAMPRDRDDEGNEPHLLGEGKVIHEREKAVLVEIDGREIWIPKSCLHDDSEAFSGKKGEDEGKIIVLSWWAEKNGHA